MLRYKFKENKKIRKLLIELEALKIIFNQFKILPQIEENLRRESLLKSALFSARIEGNPLDLEKVRYAGESKKEDDIKKIEVFNLLRAYRYLRSSKVPQKLNLALIKNIHRMVMKNLSFESGQWRKEPWAIFNQAGVAVYLAPSPFRLSKLMKEFIQMDRNLEEEIPIKAAILQFLFEKIHPFADGNGRVGRLVSSYIMKKGGYDLRGLVSLEEMIDKNRENYYRALEPSSETNLFVEFFLESLISQARLILDKLSEQKEELPEDFLLPRRREILEIIKDHPYCSFDFISRRFLSINKKTLHYDLRQLQIKGFIIKTGVTRGAKYKRKE